MACVGPHPEPGHGGAVASGVAAAQRGPHHPADERGRQHHDTAATHVAGRGPVAPRRRSGRPDGPVGVLHGYLVGGVSSVACGDDCACERAAEVDGGPRPSRRRVEQGRRHDGALRRRGRRRARRDLHRRGARVDPQPPAGARRDGPRQPRRRPARARWTPPARSSASARTGSAGSTPGLPEGDPLPPLPEGCFGLMDVEVAAEPLVRLVRSFRPHVMTTYDENGGYPHPDHIMCHKISMHAFDAAGDPAALPRRRRAVAAAEALLQPDLHQGAHHGAARGDARARARVAVRRVAEALGGPRRAARSPRRSRAATTSRSATGRCSRTPPRSTRTGRGSTARSSCSVRCGRPRTSSWARPSSTCSRARGRPVRRHPRVRGAR